jgi:hypothetical protein
MAVALTPIYTAVTWVRRHIVSLTTREHEITEETFSVRPVPRLYIEDQLPLGDSLEKVDRRVGDWSAMAGMVESVESHSCEE